jgi:hypothetical protein
MAELPFEDFGYPPPDWAPVSVFMIPVEPGEQLRRELRIPRPIRSQQYADGRYSVELPDPPSWIGVCVLVGAVEDETQLVASHDFDLDRPVYLVERSRGLAPKGGVALGAPRCSEHVSVTVAD